MEKWYTNNKTQEEIIKTAGKKHERTLQGQQWDMYTQKLTSEKIDMQEIYKQALEAEPKQQTREELLK